MEQDPDVKKKIRVYKEVELRESEFKKASELDSSELKSIHDEYFKKTVVYPLIVIFIAAAVFVLWLVGEIQKWYLISAVINYALMFLLVFSFAMAVYLFPRCIFSLIIVSKINKQDFWWHAGLITHKTRLWVPFGWGFYYVVDDEYCSKRDCDPLYRKGTEVYFLYFPGFMRNSYVGGVVVRKKE